MIQSTIDYATGGKEPTKFPLGHVVATPGALTSVPAEEIQQAIQRHHAGDWGDLDDEDKCMNERGLAQGHRLFSAYQTVAGTKFWIITEHDRLATTVLLPHEY